MNTEVRIKKLSPDAVVPTYGSPFSAGADLYACEKEPVTIEPGKTVLIHTGLSFEIPEGFAGLIYARSGLATKKGLAPANKVGVIDADYRGEIGVILANMSNEDFTVCDGDRIAQMVIARHERAEWVECDVLDETERGAGGFGSTGGSKGL